jgi:hypothetical protein
LLSLFSFTTHIYSQSQSNTECAPREQFAIELPKISFSINESTKECEKVKIVFNGSDDQIVLTSIDDTYIKHTKYGTERTVYREKYEFAYRLSGFEKEQLNKICEHFKETLALFDKNIQNQRWGKCLYLDAYFPRFLSGFYYVLCMTLSKEDIPEKIRINEELFDVSEMSWKSDQRINKWRSSEDYATKLRISAKELIFQIDKFQKRSLQKKDNNDQVTIDSAFLDVLCLFEKLYFNQNNNS